MTKTNQQDQGFLRYFYSIIEKKTIKEQDQGFLRDYYSYLLPIIEKKTLEGKPFLAALDDFNDLASNQNSINNGAKLKHLANLLKNALEMDDEVRRFMACAKYGDNPEYKAVEMLEENLKKVDRDFKFPNLANIGVGEVYDEYYKINITEIYTTEYLESTFGTYNKPNNYHRVDEDGDKGKKTSHLDPQIPSSGDDLRAESRNDSTKGIAIPAEGIAMPPEGIAMPAEGIAMPAEGIAMPAEGIAMPPEGIGKHNLMKFTRGTEYHRLMHMALPDRIRGFASGSNMFDDKEIGFSIARTTNSDKSELEIRIKLDDQIYTGKIKEKSIKYSIADDSGMDRVIGNETKLNLNDRLFDILQYYDNKKTIESHLKSKGQAEVDFTLEYGDYKVVSNSSTIDIYRKDKPGIALSLEEKFDVADKIVDLIRAPRTSPSLASGGLSRPDGYSR